AARGNHVEVAYRDDQMLHLHRTGVEELVELDREAGRLHHPWCIRHADVRLEPGPRFVLDVPAVAKAGVEAEIAEHLHEQRGTGAPRAGDDDLRHGHRASAWY